VALRSIRRATLPSSKASATARYVVNRILAEFPAGRKRFYNSRRKFPAGRKWAFEARHLGDKTSRLPMPDAGVIRPVCRRVHGGGTSAVGNPLATSGDLLFFQATYTRPARLPIWRLPSHVVACGGAKSPGMRACADNQPLAGQETISEEIVRSSLTSVQVGGEQQAQDLRGFSSRTPTCRESTQWFGGPAFGRDHWQSISAAWGINLFQFLLSPE
jgi:hypothetical protein